MKTERTIPDLRREIGALRPLVDWGMRINSQRYLPLADRLERLERLENDLARVQARREWALTITR